MAFSTPSAQLGFARAFFTNVVPLTCIAGAGAFAQYLYTLSLAYVPMSTGAQLGAWAALPALLMLGPWVKPTLQQVGWMRNEWMEEVIREKVYPALPGGEVDEEGVEKSPEFAVLMIGARCNGPFGGLHKGFAEIGKGFVQVSLPLRGVEGGIRR